MAAAKVQPNCVVAYDKAAFDMESYPFFAGLNDAWQLSWTTFSTVGYGWISPTTSANFLENMDDFRRDGSCALMSTILSFECLIGILAVSSAGALIFGKLMQFQCDAKVKFSEVVVVDYKFDDGSLKRSSENLEPFSCPMMTFRLVNLLHDNEFGEIVDASLHSVATVAKENAVNQNQAGNTQFCNALQSRRNLVANVDKLSRFSTPTTQFKRQMIMQSKEKNVNNASSNETASNGNNFPRSRSGDGSIVNKLQSFVASKRQNKNENKFNDNALGTNAWDEAEAEAETINQRIVMDQEREVEMPNLVFEKISLDPVNHPCFNLSWSVSHKLDENSPLLKKEMRNEIKNAGGRWPVNRKEELKKSIHFDQFLVSFSGFCKATGTDIYAHKVYTMDDLKFGYQFESILVQNQDGSIGLNTNDIDHTKKTQPSLGVK